MAEGRVLRNPWSWRLLTALLPAWTLTRALTDNVDVALRMSSAAVTLTMMKEAFGAYRAVIGDCPQAVQAGAWAEVAETLKTFETAAGFIGPAEVRVAAASRPT